MTGTARRAARPLGGAATLGVAAATVMLLLTAAAAAQSPFGVGLPEAAGRAPLPWIAALQADFYRDLTRAISSLKDSGGAFAWLAGVSFLYGIVHAAGPGHGKFVISSYLVASRATALRGVMLAFVSAMIQAAVAVALIGLLALALNRTSMAITETAGMLESASYALMAGLGFYLLAAKARRAFTGGTHDHRHDHGMNEAACGCGHNHAPAPTTGSALAAIMSVGLRPCSGALIVLVFSLAQGFFWAGVASTFLMGLGTAITVAGLAMLAVGAKGLAVRLAGSGMVWPGRLLLAIELLGAFAIAALGAMLFAGSLAA